MQKPYRTSLRQENSGELNENVSKAVMDLSGQDGYGWRRSAQAMASSDILINQSNEILRLMGLSARGGETVPESVVADILAKMQEEGIIWNHLADALVKNGNWTNTYPGNAKMSLAAWLARLGPWVAQAPRRDVAEMYQAFKSLQLKEFLAAQVDLAGASLEEAASLGAGEGAGLVRLMANPTLTKDLALECLEYLIIEQKQYENLQAILKTVTDRFGALPAETNIKIMNALLQVLPGVAGKIGYSGLHIPAGRQIENILYTLGQDPKTPADIISKMFLGKEFKPSGDTYKVQLLFHPGVTEAERDELLAALTPDQRVNTLWAIASRVPEAPLKYLQKVARPGLAEYKLVMIMKHPSADEQIWRLAVGNPNKEVRAALANTPLASDPEVRKSLLSSTVAEVLAGLLKTATAEEWPALFYRLLRKDKEYALRSLAAATLPKGANIPAGWIKPFILHNQAAVREMAYKCLSKCGGGFVGASAPAPARAPRLKRS